MVYLEYSLINKQVIKIHETIPELVDKYDYTITDQISVGDEFELTIWINETDNEKNLLSYSAIRNNPQAMRLLKENTQLKLENQKLQEEDLNNKEAIAELYLMTLGGI
jgi:hypothetical protein